jgi:hypothetical protein
MKKRRNGISSPQKLTRLLEVRDMPLSDVDNFLYKVCRYIKYKGAHAGISHELKNHIEDRIQDYLDSGHNEDTATKMAVAAMGDPVELGKNLNKLHRPYLGWALRIVNTLIILTCISVFLSVYSMITTTLYSQDSLKINNDILYSKKLTGKARIDNRTVIMKKLIVDVNNTVYIRYNNYNNPFHTTQNNMLNFKVHDNKGNTYSATSTNRGNQFYKQYLICIDYMDKTTEKVILEYDYYNRKMRFEISLKRGDSK